MITRRQVAARLATVLPAALIPAVLTRQKRYKFHPHFTVGVVDLRLSVGATKLRPTDMAAFPAVN